MDGRRRNIILVFQHDITILACFVDFGDVTYVHSKQILQANVILNQLLLFQAQANLSKNPMHSLFLV